MLGYLSYIPRRCTGLFMVLLTAYTPFFHFSPMVRDLPFPQKLNTAPQIRMIPEEFDTYQRLECLSAAPQKNTLA